MSVRLRGLEQVEPLFFHSFHVRGEVSVIFYALEYSYGGLQIAVEIFLRLGIGLTLAHQEFRQLQSRSQDVAASVLSNCLTRICFRLGEADAEKFAGGFSFFDANALQNQGTGEAIARIERAEYDFNLRTVLPNPIETSTARQMIEKVRSISRKEYASPAEQIAIDFPIVSRSVKPDVPITTPPLEKAHEKQASVDPEKYERSDEGGNARGGQHIRTCNEQSSAWPRLTDSMSRSRSQPVTEALILL